MGHTGIHAFGDCVRRIGLGRFATVVELRIPYVYAWGVSNPDYPKKILLLAKEKKNRDFAENYRPKNNNKEHP